jgi:1,4-alpha-glucan branching enzyme
MPYVKKNGVFPVGEDWLYKVMSDTYLPLLGMLSQLQHEGVSSCMALTLTPVLVEQLADDYIKERFVTYLETMAEHAGEDVQDFEYFNDEERKELAAGYRDTYIRKKLAFQSIGGDLLGAILEFEDAGLIETLTSSATHAFLPGLDERSVRAQVRIGVQSYEERTGRAPAGFWLPECAYHKGVEDILAEEGVRYFLVDQSAMGGRASTYAWLAGGTPVAALSRSQSAHVSVWDEEGYPSDARYLDSTKYYHNSGLLYWSVTGADVPIDEKRVYVPDEARRGALGHAEGFVNDIVSELSSAPRDDDGRSPIVLASYDTELFGHGWREGLYWMEILLRSLQSASSIELVTPSRYLDVNPPSARVELEETTWGTNRDSSTWFNNSTDWMWKEIGRSSEELYRLLDQDLERSEEERLALVQAARELLLLESSDWPYMVAKDRAAGYATERFNAHLERFRLASGAVGKKGRDLPQAALSEIEEQDSLVPALDTRKFELPPERNENGDDA